jgi:hypothetical protein
MTAKATGGLTSATERLASAKHVPGISLRDWLAGQIASGMAAYSGTNGIGYSPNDIAGRSYQIADAMLICRKEPK